MKEQRYEKVVEGDGLTWFLVELFIFLICWILIIYSIATHQQHFLRFVWLIISYIAVAGMIPNLNSRKVYWRKI